MPKGFNVCGVISTEIIITPQVSGPSGQGVGVGVGVGIGVGVRVGVGGGGKGIVLHC